MARRYCLDCACEVEQDDPDDDLICQVCGGEAFESCDENPRERGDDDGVEYADPGDYLEDRLFD